MIYHLCKQDKKECDKIPRIDICRYNPCVASNGRCVYLYFKNRVVEGGYNDDHAVDRY